MKIDRDAPARIVLRVLTKDVHRPVYQLIIRRYEAMERELHYRASKEHLLTSRFHESWPLQRIEVALAFNSFYQTVIGPLGAASRRWNAREFRDLSIEHGSMNLSPDRAEDMRHMVNEFDQMMSRLDIPAELLTAATTEDLLFRLERSLKEEDETN